MQLMGNTLKINTASLDIGIAKRAETKKAYR